MIKDLNKFHCCYVAIVRNTLHFVSVRLFNCLTSVRISLQKPRPAFKAFFFANNRICLFCAKPIIHIFSTSSSSKLILWVLFSQIIMSFSKGTYTPSGLQTACESEREVFLLGRDGLNNDAVNFSKHFNPKYVIKMSQMKRAMTD